MSSASVILDVAARGVLYCTVPILAGIFVYNRLTLGRCTSKNQLNGKTVVITGGNSGIGYETAKELARRGARVMIGCRNRTRAENAVKRLINESGNTNICWKELDTSCMKSVRAFADEVLSSEKNVHILINNAGIPGPKEKCMTEEGLEITFATNYVGHFLLTNLLLPRLVESAPSRIINLSSVAHFFGKLNFDDLQMEKNYHGDKAYTNSKLAVVLFTLELSHRLSGTGVTANSVHPGVVDTPLAHRVTKVGGSTFNFFGRVFGTKSAEEGAQTSIHVAVSDEGGQLTGKYFTDCKPKLPWAVGQNQETARKLWEATAQLTGLRDKAAF